MDFLHRRHAMPLVIVIRLGQCRQCLMQLAGDAGRLGANRKGHVQSRQE